MRRIAIVSLCLLVTMYAKGQNAPAPPFAGFYAAPGIAGAAPIGLSPGGAGDHVAFIAQDFNHDGHADLLTVGTGGEISLALNDGSGHFAAPVISTPSPLVPTYDAIAVDVNADGYPDLVTLQFPPSTPPGQPAYGVNLAVYINQKNGTFAPGSIVPLPNTQLPFFSNITPVYQNAAIGAGVSGASAFPDIAAEYVVTTPQATPGLTTSTLYRAVFLNDGHGGFSSPASNLTSVGLTSNFILSPKRLLVADVNNDGKPDLITGSSANGYNVDAALGNGNGTFAAPLANSVATLSSSAVRHAPSEWITLAHVSGSANAPDLLISAGPNVYLAASNGDGTYKPPAAAAIYGNSIAYVQVADTNGDGVADLVVGGFGSLGVYPGKTDGSFGPLVSAVVDGGGYLNSPAIAIADVDGDGKLDFVAADRYSANVTFGKGLGDGNFLAAPVLGNPAGTGALSLPPGTFVAVAAADMNGDGKTDLVGSHLATGDIVTALTGAGGSFTYKVALLRTTAIYAPQPVTGDFNGDGKQDILVTQSIPGGPVDGAIGVALSNGDGTVQTPLTFAIPFPHNISGFSFAVGDVNGDGKQDIVMVYSGDSGSSNTRTPGGYVVALGKGDGTFQVGSFVASGSSPEFVVLGNFHGSHAPLDMVINDSGFGYSVQTPQVSLLKGVGDGTFGTSTVLQSGYYPSVLLTADLNKDGNADLVISSFSGYPNGAALAGIYVLPGDGDGTFAAPTQLETGTAAADVVAVDINGDGNLDLVADSGGPSSVGTISPGMTVFPGNGDGTFGTGATYPLAGSGLLFAGNFLGDNTESIVANDVGAGFFENLGGTSVAVTATNLFAGQTATLSALVTPTLSGRPVATGTGTFLDGTTVLGTGTLANGAASLQTAQLAAGPHTLRFAYAGDASFQPNTAALNVTVPTAPPPDFTVTPSAATLTVTRGQSATTQLTIAANAGFSGPVSLSCSGLPAETACSFSPASVTLSAAQAAIAAMTITTISPTTAALHIDGLPGVKTVATLSLLLLPAWCGRRRLRLMGLAAMLVCAISLTGCGSSSSTKTADPGSPAGTYAVTVMAAAGTGSAAVSHTITINLIIQ